VELRLDLSAVVVAVTEGSPRVLVVDSARGLALPEGALDPRGDRTLELALRAQVLRQTGLTLRYVEQLYTFGDRDRDPAEREGGARALSLAYLALAQEQPPQAEGARWAEWYELLPWEDRRVGQEALEAKIEAALVGWAGSSKGRQERISITFGLGGTPWDEYRVLERYELLYEVGLVAESRQASPSEGLGRPMALDHRRILATAVGRLRGKLEFRPVVFELLPEVFTLLQLQQVVEALAGVPLHKQNFRRLVDRGGLVEGTGQVATNTGGRPAELFRFRREVLRERPEPGVGLPLARRVVPE
jgi:hypothetical protein